MKRSIRTLAAALAAITAMSCASISAFADKLKSEDGVMYRYSDSGENKGAYTGWVRNKSGDYFYYSKGKRVKSSWLKVNGKPTYYLRKDGRMAVGKLKIGGVSYTFGTDGKLITEASITAAAKNVTADGMTLKFAVDGGADSELRLSGYYRIEQETASGWELYKKDVFDTIEMDGYTVIKDGYECSMRYYGAPLSAGKYRVMREMTEVKSDGSEKTHTVYTEFEIKGEEPGMWGITLNVKKASRTGLTFTLNRAEGYPADGALRLRTEYRITRLYDNGKFYNYSYPDPAYEIKDGLSVYHPEKEVLRYETDDFDIIAKKAYERTIDEYYCGELEPGRYRLVVYVNCVDDDGELITDHAYNTEFEIK